MKITKQISDQDIRKRAEDIYNEKSRHSYSMDTEKEKLLHELEVHQIELELQNEELIRSRFDALEAADKFIELYDFAPFGYFTLSSGGLILEVNLRGSQMLELERVKLINKPFSHFILPDKQAGFFDFLRNVFESGKKERCEVTIITEKKKSFYVMIGGIALRKGDKCLINLIDISERKLAEKAIIENQRLGAIGEMTSSIAHDFNNSLQMISGNLELAMSGNDLPESVIQYLRAIKTTVEDATKRVQVLKRFTGIKKDEKKRSLTDLNCIIGEVINQMRPLWKDDAESKGLSVNINTRLNSIPGIVCDPADIRTALYNIFKNSLEAMPKGGFIVVETGKRGNEIYVTITDSGTGMTEEIRTRVFQPFYSTKGLDLGRGLGMSSVLNIIREHGGNIVIKHSAPGKGTTFEITLPVSDAEEVINDEVTTKTNGLKGALSILWVDDEVTIKRMASEMVKMLGHNIDTAGSGKEALEYLEGKE
jgi:signal transduction histidine kinase